MAKTIEESNYVLPGDQQADRSRQLKCEAKWPGYHFCTVQLSREEDMQEMRDFMGRNTFHVHLTEGMQPLERSEYSGRRDTVVLGLKIEHYRKMRSLLDEKQNAKRRQRAGFTGSDGPTIGEEVLKAKNAPRPVVSNDD